jgi:lysophospholipase L1-like esterase
MATSFPTFDKALNDLSIFRVWREGWALPTPFAQAAYIDPNNISGGQSINIAEIGTGFNGFMCLADGISLYTDKPVFLQIVSNTYPSGDATIMTRNPGFDWRQIVNGAITIDGRFMFEGQKQLRINILEEVTGGGVNITGGLKMTANLINPYRLTLSQLNRAEKVIYWLGDSITGLTSVGTRKFLADDFHIYQVENAINQEYVDEGVSLSIRTVNKAVGGQTSFDCQKYIANRVADIDQADLIMFAYGTNEAINNVSTTDFQSYINYAWNWFKRRYPNSHMILVGATPLNNNTNNTRLIDHRAVMSSFVTATADARLSYVSMENAFDRTVLSNYTSNDGVHPGTQACFNSMASILSAHILGNNDIRRALNLPLI